MKYLVMVILVFLSVNAYSGQTSGWGKITRLYINADGSVMRVFFDQPVVNPDGCSSGEYYMKQLTEQTDIFVSAVLAAFHSQKEVRFWISGCTSIPFWGGTRPQLFDIEVKP